MVAKERMTGSGWLAAVVIMAAAGFGGGMVLPHTSPRDYWVSPPDLQSQELFGGGVSLRLMGQPSCIMDRMVPLADDRGGV